MTEHLTRALRAVPVNGLPEESFASHADLLARRGHRAPYIQDALAVDFTSDLVSDEILFGPQPTRRAELPDPRLAAAHLAQAVVEIAAGTRNPVQLLRWTTPEVYAVLARRALTAQRRAREAGTDVRRRRPAVVRRVIVCEPADGVAECTVVVVDGGRVRAIAMRLIGQDGGWRLGVLRVG